MLSTFADIARIHAAEQHGFKGSDEELVERLDQILDHESQHGTPDEFESLAMCYGAWLGQWLARKYGAVWVGLQEPVPPRLQLNGNLFSPIDAVKRRLNSPRAASVLTLLRDLERWSKQRESQMDEAINRAAWDQLARDPRFVELQPRRLSREEALAEVDPWIREDVKAGPRMLCLAAGGGTHGPLHAMAGAEVTVVDISDVLLEIDRRAAKACNISLTTLQASMTDLGSLNDGAFDLVLQPVSHSYVQEIRQVHTEVARVLSIGGVYVTQFKQPLALQAKALPGSAGYVISRTGAEGMTLLPNGDVQAAYREPGTVEYVHSLDACLGELCRSGLVIEDLVEPPRGDAWAPVGSAAHQACYTPPYLKIKARRVR